LRRGAGLLGYDGGGGDAGFEEISSREIAHFQA
jgi:hypothetical protein